MALRIIDNKRIDLTDTELNMYQKIIKSYTVGNNSGEDLFKDLFETDNNGIIIFLKPPSSFRTTFEVYLFLMNIFQHQHIRLMHSQVADICNQMKDKIKELDEKIKILENK